MIGRRTRMTRKMDVVSGLVAAWALSCVPAHTHAHAFSLQQLHQGRSPSPEPRPDSKRDDDDDDDDDRGHDHSNNVDSITQTGNPYFPVPGTAITMTSSLSFFNPTPSIPITTAPSGTSAPFLVFEDIQNTTVCGENAISWEYAGDQSFTLALAVTNEGVDGVDPSAQPITMILEVDTNGLNSSNTYPWSPVRLPAGAYAAVISIPEPDALYISPTFYVFNSSDHSCLSSSPATTTSLTGSSTTAVVSSSQTNTGTALPVEGAVSKGLSGGSIAGIVIGILALVGLGGALLVLLRRCRSRSAASSALFGRSRRMSGYIEKRDPPSPGLGAAVGIGGFPGARSRGRSGDVSTNGAGVSRGFGGGSSDFAVHNVHGGSSQEEVASLADQEKAVENARPSTFASDAEVLGVLALHSFPPNTYRDSGASGPVSQGGIIGGPSRHSSYSARSVASDPFESDGGEVPTPSPSVDRLSLTRSVSDPFNPFASPADLEQNHAQAGSRERQVPVQLFMPTSATSSPRPGIPRDISTSSMAESDADTYTYEQEADHLSEGAATTTGTVGTAGTMVPPPRRMPPAAPAMSAGRRTMSSRKPVPVYAPSVSGEALELTEPATPRSAYYRQHSSYSTHSGSGNSGNSGNDWSSAAAHSHSPATASPMSSGSHLPQGAGAGAGNWKRDSNSLSISGSTSSASASRSVSVVGGASTISPSSPTTLGSPSTVVNGHASFLSGHQYLPELNHKSSFGDRPVHYLIPDPPSENVL